MPYICSKGHVFVHTAKRIQIVNQSITEELYGCPLCNVFNKEYEEYVKPQEDILDTRKAAHDGEVAKLKAEGYIVHEVFSAHCVMKLVAKTLLPEKVYTVPYNAPTKDKGYTFTIGNRNIEDKKNSTTNLVNTPTVNNNSSNFVSVKFDKSKKFLINGYSFATVEVCKGVNYIEFPIQGEIAKLAGTTPEDDLAVASVKLEKFLLQHEIPQEA